MKKDIFDLSGKTAIVSGASRGIGESTARLLAAHGAHVICSSRKLDGSGAVADAIRKEGGKATALACHVGETAAIDAFAAEVEKQFGRVDILVNNAAANPYFGHVLDTPLDAMQKTIDVNIRGFFYMSQKIGLIMKRQGGGAIVNTASVNGVRPGLFQGVYSVTKAAIINMTQAFAKECAPLNIRVNAVLPGITDTKFASALVKNEQNLKSFLPYVAMQRVAQPDEIAPAILFLASEAASYITGSCITADGGYLA